MVDMLNEDEDLACVMKLHEFVMKVRKQNEANKERVGNLKAMFTDLGNEIQAVYKDQTSTASS